jgi:RNA polymerase sigma-70 factor (ECF subfamily)
MGVESPGYLLQPWIMPQRDLGVADLDSPSECQAGGKEICAGSPKRVADSESSDESLIEAISRGEGEALSPLFRRYASLVRIVAERILRDSAEAEDLLQEVFLFVFRRAALFDPSRGSARSWLVQVTYHRAFDRRRHLMARHFYTNLDLEEAVAGGEEPSSAANLYEQTVEGVLGREALDRIAAALSEVQQRVLRLYFVEGHTQPEIAALIGQTPANVRNHYYRALEKMRALVFPAKLQEK